MTHWGSSGIFKRLGKGRALALMANLPYFLKSKLFSLSAVFGIQDRGREFELCLYFNSRCLANGIFAKPCVVLGHVTLHR